MFCTSNPLCNAVEPEHAFKISPLVEEIPYLSSHTKPKSTECDPQWRLCSVLWQGDFLLFSRNTYCQDGYGEAHIKALGVLVHKSKGLNGPNDSSKQAPVSEISAAYVGWYDIRTGIRHPVIWGSSAENTRPRCAAAIGKKKKRRNAWMGGSVISRGCKLVGFYSPIIVMGANKLHL